jgi:transposase
MAQNPAFDSIGIFVVAMATRMSISNGIEARRVRNPTINSAPQTISTTALCRRLQQIPGFGPLVSTATVAAIGNGAAFRRGRDFAAWVGVVPRQYSTAGKQKLLGISKRGNIYLRRMLIHGARAVLFRIRYDTGSFGQWVHRLTQRAPRNKVVVAIANKLARMAWAVLSTGKDYRHQRLQPVAA